MIIDRKQENRNIVLEWGNTRYVFTPQQIAEGTMPEFVLTVLAWPYNADRRGTLAQLQEMAIHG
jgi:hypothetical protein